MKQKQTKTDREYWKWVRKTAAEVRKLPRWMGGTK